MTGLVIFKEFSFSMILYSSGGYAVATKMQSQSFSLSSCESIKVIPFSSNNSVLILGLCFLSLSLMANTLLFPMDS